MAIRNVKIGEGVSIFQPDLVNLYECEIGENTKLGAFVEIQKNSRIGKNCKISSHSFICEGVQIEDEVFIGHGVKFINDKYPHSTINGGLQTEKDWKVVPTLVKKGASIGTNATILCGLTIGENAIIGAGSVVTRDVLPNSTVCGNPAKKMSILNNNNFYNVTDSPKKVEVKFLDLNKIEEPIKEEIKEEINKVIATTSFAMGPVIKEFEEEFARFCNKKYAIAVNNGTSALYLALISKGITSGEVITVPNTFIATAEAISFAGAKPVFVDIDESYNIDTAKIEEKITPETRAIIPVHLYGQPANMEPIRRIAEKYNLVIIEDCCQAHGASYNNQKVPVTSIGCFSFYPGKNLGAYGEGGAIVTDDENLALKARLIRDHGSDKKYYHKILGFNFRMSSIQAAVLKVKLKYLDSWNEQRRANARLYNELLRDLPEINTPIEPFNVGSVYHLYVIRTSERDKLQEYLRENNIFTGIHYPVPLHFQDPYKHPYIKEGSFPKSEKFAKEILSLPMFPQLNKEEIAYVCEKIRGFFRR